jgi:hypothetical protein
MVEGGFVEMKYNFLELNWFLKRAVNLHLKFIRLIHLNIL